MHPCFPLRCQVQELGTYSNTDALAVQTEQSKQALAQERRRLLVRKEAMKKVQQQNLPARSLI